MVDETYKPAGDFTDEVINNNSGSCHDHSSHSQPSVGNLKGDPAVYPNKDNLNQFEINSNPTFSRLYPFPRGVIDEVLDMGTGGNRDGKLPFQPATDLAQILMAPPTQESMNFSFSNTPWMELDGVNKRVIPLTFKTILANSPINIPLFEPTRVNNCGYLTWRYIGKEPIHGVIQGDLNVLVRTSYDRPDAANRLILSMDSMAESRHFIEEGQGGGRRFLSTSMASLDKPQPLAVVGEFTDQCLDIRQSLIAAIAGVGQRFDGAINGFFQSTTPFDQIATSDAQGPVGPEVLTTNWIDVSDIDFATEALVMYYLNGRGNRGRVRIKLSETVYSYRTDQSSDSNSMRVYRLPVGTKAVQIYYAGRGSTVGDDPANVFVKRVPAIYAPTYDTLKGMFVRKHFAVNRDITFLPGQEYYLHLMSTVYNGATNVSHGFRYEGGGLSIVFDAGHLRKELYDNYFEVN